MIKTFPKSRICVIDCFSSFESGLQKAREFAKKHNVSLNTSDGRKIILGFCVKNIEELYNNTKSRFPKVLCISNKSNNPNIRYFVDNHFDKMMKHLSMPYCGKHDLVSPDLEFAAEKSLSYLKIKRKATSFKANLNLRNVN